MTATSKVVPADLDDLEESYFVAMASPINETTTKRPSEEQE